MRRLPLSFAVVVAVAVTSAGCGSDELVVRKIWPAPYAEPLVGVDSDGEGGLWLAFNRDAADYYENDAARIVHVDADWNELANWQFNDSYTSLNGIAYSGGAVWANLGGSFSDDVRIRKLDPTTGAEVDSFAMEIGIVDLAVRDGELLLSNMWNQVVGIDRIDGGERWRAELALPEGGTLRGIAVNAVGTWVLCQETDEIYRVDDTGAIAETFTIPGHQYTYSDRTDHLTFDGDQFVVTHDHDLIWLELP